MWYVCTELILIISKDWEGGRKKSEEETRGSAKDVPNVAATGNCPTLGKRVALLY